MLNTDQVVGHRVNTQRRLAAMLAAGVTTVEADIVRFDGSEEEFFFAHPLEMLANPHLARESGHAGHLTLADYREALEANPALTLLCEVKVAQEGYGFVGCYQSIREQIGEAVRDRFVVISYSRLELWRAMECKLSTGILTGDDPAFSEMVSIHSLGPQFYLPDQFRVRRELIPQLRDRGIKVIPFVVNDRSMAEKLVDWGCDGVLTDDPAKLIG